MKENGIERNLVVFLFVLVLITFSFAEKASRKYERFYTSAPMLKKNGPASTEIATSISTSTVPKN
jgi:hypothetical protein